MCTGRWAAPSAVWQNISGGGGGEGEGRRLGCNKDRERLGPGKPRNTHSGPQPHTYSQNESNPTKMVPTKNPTVRRLQFYLHVLQHINNRVLVAASNEVLSQSRVHRWPAHSSTWSDSWDICAVLQVWGGIYSHFCLPSPTEVLICAGSFGN